MLTILVAAGEDEKDFCNKLEHLLKGQLGSGAVKLYGSASFEKAVQKGKVIVVYKQPGPIPKRLVGAQTAVAIVDSESWELLNHVSGTRLPAITCGLRSRDTISLSSMSEESAVVELRRCISCLDGSSAEPQEIPLKRPGLQDDFLLMTLAAILILAGKTQSLQNGII